MKRWEFIAIVVFSVVLILAEDFADLVFKLMGVK